MSTYAITFAPKAKDGLEKLKKSEPSSFKKAVKLLNEIAVHPTSGTGHPEPLKGKPENRWSRVITKKHRLVYCVHEAEVYVEVLSSYGHYDDK
jgi:toxin YoeB